MEVEMLYVNQIDEIFVFGQICFFRSNYFHTQNLSLKFV